MWRLAVLTCILFFGCTIPAHMYFRNYSSKTVQLKATLIDRKYFSKLPNKVNFYDTSTREKQYYGELRYDGLVTWVDSTTLNVKVPPYTVIDLADVSNGLTLGARQPDVLLVLISDHKVDTLIVNDFLSVEKKFKSVPYGIFRDQVYYYDFH